FGAIFEDDIFISAEAKQFLDRDTLKALPRFDIMQLCNLKTRPRLAMTVSTVSSGHRICAGPNPSLGTQALIYHRPAVQRILQEITDISAAIDTMLFNRMDVFGLRIVSVRPAVIQHAEFHSMISVPGPKVRNKLWREFMRGVKCISRIASFSAAWLNNRLT